MESISSFFSVNAMSLHGWKDTGLYDYVSSSKCSKHMVICQCHFDRCEDNQKDCHPLSRPYSV